MLRIRLLEDRLQELCYAGEAGDLHFSKGEEAIAVGVCSELRDTDYSVTHHRTIAHAVARGVPLKGLVAELLGKATGINGGRCGEMHLHHFPSRYMFSFQLVGTCVSVAAGLAWAAKRRQEENIVACFIGDAATSNAQFHEGLNIAAVQKVPLLIVVEDNHIAGNIRPEYYLPETLGMRFHSFGIGWHNGDGNKLDEVTYLARNAIEEVRRYGKPFVLIFDTTRLCHHKQGQADARSKEEILELSKRDPLIYEENRKGITRLEVLDRLKEEIEDAITFARDSPIPMVESS